jgi:plasmid stability protein
MPDPTNPDLVNRSRKLVDMTTLTLHNVPDEVCDALAERANRAGQSMEEYTLAILKQELSFPDQLELFERINAARQTLPTIDRESLLDNLAADRR